MNVHMMNLFVGQVSQLQEALESVSSAVFRTSSLDGANFDISGLLFNLYLHARMFVIVYVDSVTLFF